DRVGGLPGGRHAGGARHAQRLVARTHHHGGVPDGVHVRVGDRAQGAVDDDLAGVRDLQGGAAGDRMDGEAGGPHGDRGGEGGPHGGGGGEGGPVGGGEVVGGHGGDGGVLVHGDAEPAEHLPQVRPALVGQPVAERAAGGEGDVEVRAGLGDLGRRLHPGQA